MKRWLLLDVNGPLGQVTKVWLKAVRSTDLKDKDMRKFRELLDIYRSREYTRDPIAYKRIAEIVDELMTNERVLSSFKDHLRDHFAPHTGDIRETLSNFNRVILYSNMPHSVVRSVAEVLRDLTDRKIYAFGYHPALPSEYGKTKERFAFLLPWQRHAQIFHVTDEDNPLDSRFRRYVYIGNVHSPAEMRDMVTRYLSLRSKRLE